MPGLLLVHLGWPPTARCSLAAKRGRANYSLVRPHSRKVNILARRPLGTELAALSTRALFYAKFKAVMARVLGGGA